jgi:hypothetical protein
MLTCDEEVSGESYLPNTKAEIGDASQAFNLKKLD